MEQLSTKQDAHTQRRRHLGHTLPEGALCCLSGGTLVLRNGDTHHPFRANSTFWYLTGYTAPGSVLVLRKHEGHLEAHLFCPDRDPDHEQWEGARLGHEAVLERTTDLFTHPLSDWPKKQALWVKEARSLWADAHDAITWAQCASWSQEVMQHKRASAPSLHDVSTCVGALRVRKDAEELEATRHAIAATVQGFERLMHNAQPGHTERMLEADFMHAILSQGAQGVAYPSIVASGANACVLHYTANQATLTQDQWVLVDAGAEWGHYAADITRTFPVNGRASGLKRDVYACVLEAQKAGIEQAMVGGTHNAIQEVMVRIMVQGLLDWGCLTGSLDALCEQKAHRAYYPHGSGHWLGLDVHDLGPYVQDKKPIPFAPGMLLTVEPGLYFPEHDTHLPEALRGFGVRIEDDVLITETGPEILSSALPKEVADLEACCRG